MEDWALDDLRVIDFSDGISGSYCSHLCGHKIGSHQAASLS